MMPVRLRRFPECLMQKLSPVCFAGVGDRAGCGGRPGGGLEGRPQHLGRPWLCPDGAAQAHLPLLHRLRPHQGPDRALPGQPGGRAAAARHRVRQDPGQARQHQVRTRSCSTRLSSALAVLFPAKIARALMICLLGASLFWAC
jgi:hypothetical protein